MAIYIRNDIDFIIRDDIGLFIEGEMESIFVETTHKGHKMLVGEIYRVPNTDPVVAIERYDNILDKIQNVHNVIIGMDQNLYLLKINTHKHTSDFLNTIFEHYFVPCISKPTRMTQQIPISYLTHLLTILRILDQHLLIKFQNPRNHILIILPIQ